jgi:hypothetical protein
MVIWNFSHEIPLWCTITEGWRVVLPVAAVTVMVAVMGMSPIAAAVLGADPALSPGEAMFGCG